MFVHTLTTKCFLGFYGAFNSTWVGIYNILPILLLVYPPFPGVLK